MSTGHMGVYRSEDLDDEKYLTTDFIDNEQSKATYEYNDKELPTCMGIPQRTIQDVLHIEDLPTLIDNPCNIGKNQGYLSPLQYESATGTTKLVTDQNKPQTPPPPLPLDRQTSEIMYEDIPEIPEYLELEEIPTPADIQPPNPVTITATQDTGVRKRVAVLVLVTIGVLTCIATVLTLVFIITVPPKKNEEYDIVKTTTQSQGTFTSSVQS